MIFWFPLYIKLLSALKEHVLIRIELKKMDSRMQIEQSRIDRFLELDITSYSRRHVTVCVCVCWSKVTAVFDLSCFLLPKQPVIFTGLHKT